MSNVSKVIIFFIPPEKDINGGILSIFSLAGVTRKILGSVNAKVYISVYPGFDSYMTNDLFENDEKIYDFESIVRLHPSPKNLLIHIPEYAAGDVAQSLKEYIPYLHDVVGLQLNILNQNIKHMPPPDVISDLFLFTTNITQSTAHIKYCSQGLADQYSIPTHHMSVFIDEQQYKATEYRDKDKTILVSPDNHPLKSSILDNLRSNLDGFSIVTISGLTYEEYKAAISKAYCVITFGEGMDGYFIEPIYSGTVAFSVYNEDFFPSPSFTDLPSVYSSYEKMNASIIEDITSLQVLKTYKSTVNATYSALKKYYNHADYQKKVEQFYKQEYSFWPSERSYKILAARIARISYERLELSKSQILEQENAITELRDNITHISTQREELLASLEKIRNSRSWRAISPLRYAGKIKRKLLGD